MKLKQELLQELKNSFGDTDRFIANANLNGGMHIEARVKLLENQVQDLYFYVKQMIDALPEPDDGR